MVIRHARTVRGRRTPGRVSADPPVESTQDVTQGYLCLAYAQAGNLNEARRHFKLAEARLRIFKLNDILKRCEEALAGGGN